MDINMDINDQLSVEELLQGWVNVAYRSFQGKSNSKENAERRRQIVERLKTKGIDNIVIDGVDDASYTLIYNQHNSKRMKKIMIEK
ncbi:MAG: hypothetical protein JJT76_17005 [Clostridiaceae bacterium]|nr:hypothetical protein [Clostridiaceae bacterium]